MPQRRSVAGFMGSVASGAISGVVAAGLLLGISYLAKDQLSSWTTKFAASCEHPSGLVEVPIIVDEASDSPLAAISDGDFGTTWTPRLEPKTLKSPHQAFFMEDPSLRTLNVRVPKGSDIKLVCANNGLANDRTHYQMFGKVRTVEVWANDDKHKTRSSLGVEPTESMQQLQEVARNLHGVDTLHLQLDDSFAGETVITYDPDDCDTDSAERLKQPDGETAELLYPRGCIRAAVPRAGISELVLFTRP